MGSVKTSTPMMILSLEVNDPSRFVKEESPDKGLAPYQIYAQVKKLPKTNKKQNDIKTETKQLVSTFEKEISPLTKIKNDSNTTSLEEHGMDTFSLDKDISKNIRMAEDVDQKENEDSAMDEGRTLNEDECDLDNEMTTQVIVSELNALASNIDDLLSDVDVEYL